MDVEATALGLIDLLYQGLEDNGAFSAFAESLTLALGARAAALALDLDPCNPQRPTSTFGFDPSFLKSYEEYYHSINVHRRTSGHLHRSGAVLTTEETCPDQVL